MPLVTELLLKIVFLFFKPSVDLCLRCLSTFVGRSRRLQKIASYLLLDFVSCGRNSLQIAEQF